MIRENPSARQAHTNPKEKNPWKEQIRRIRITPMRRIYSSLIFCLDYCFIWISMRLCGALIFTDLTDKKISGPKHRAPAHSHYENLSIIKTQLLFLLFCCPSTSVPIPRNIIMRNTGRSLLRAVTDNLFVRLLLPLVSAQHYNLRFSIIII